MNGKCGILNCLLFFIYDKKNKKRWSDEINHLNLYREDTIKHVIQCIRELFLSVKAVTLIFISGRGSAILSAKQGKSGPIYNLVKN